MTEISNPIFVLPTDMPADARLVALEEALIKAVETFHSGNVPRLDGMDTEVAILCQQVMHLPTGEAAEYLQRLQALSDVFTELGDAMAVERDALRDDLGNLQNRHKAHRAYGMQGGFVPDSDKKDSE